MKGYTFWVICGGLFVLLVALTTGLAIYLRRLRPKVTRSDFFLNLNSVNVDNSFEVNVCDFVLFVLLHVRGNANLKYITIDTDLIVYANSIKKQLWLMWKIAWHYHAYTIHISVQRILSIHKYKTFKKNFCKILHFRNHSPCNDRSCCECFKPHNKRASITRRYTELQEDFSWVTSDSDYDHLSRPGQAKSKLRIDFDPTYSRTTETGDEYSSTTLPCGSNVVTSEDEYSHIKGNGQAANSIYDTLQRTKVQRNENVYRGDNDSVIF